MDSDLDSVFVVDAPSSQLLATVKVGRQPEKVLIAPDGLVYVTNRMDRSVSVIGVDHTELARIAVGVEPVGLAVSSDARTLYVVNSTALASSEYGTLMAIDTRSRTLRWETPVGPEPRAVTLLGDGRAAVMLYKKGDLVLLDTAKGDIVRAGSDVVSQLNRRSQHAFKPSSTDVVARPRGVEAVITSSDGTQVHAVTLLSTEVTLDTPTADVPVGVQSGSAGYSGGSCGSTAVAAPAILTFDSQGNALVDDVSTCVSDGSERPPMLLTTNVPRMPVQGPKAITSDSSGSFLFVANFESNNVAIVPTANRPSSSTFGTDVGAPVPDNSQFGFGGTVRQLVAVGAGPTGIAVSHDGNRAWVYNAFDHSISRLEAVSGRVANVSTTKLADDVLPADVVAGRKLFFSAVDPRMNNPSAGISCGSCHLEGREDGHVWNFPEGPRQTPSLAGRMMSKTAPFHWNGEFSDMGAFMNLTVQRRMGGSGVTSVMEGQVAAFIDAMPAADNPHRGLSGEALAAGKAAFDKAECGSCHAGAALTDNGFADVGTLVRSGPVLDRADLVRNGFNTPSLLGLARTAPFLHDGSAESLRARILQGKDSNLHGKTGLLSDREVDDLVLYLKSL